MKNLPMLKIVGRILFQLRRNFLLLLVVFLGGCVLTQPPVEEYTLAKVALDSAKAVEAPRHSSGYYHQAEEAYRKGKEFFEDRDYTDAKKQFLKAKSAAEKAENSARLIRHKNGEVL
jgi:ABC-type uncharacterized transport system auxiliary subunit